MLTFEFHLECRHFLFYAYSVCPAFSIVTVTENWTTTLFYSYCPWVTPVIFSSLSPNTRGSPPYHVTKELVAVSFFFPSRGLSQVGLCSFLINPYSFSPLVPHPAAITPVTSCFLLVDLCFLCSPHSPLTIDKNQSGTSIKEMSQGLAWA